MTYLCTAEILFVYSTHQHRPPPMFEAMEPATTHHAASSPDGRYVASINRFRLLVRDLHEGTFYTHPLPTNYKNKRLLWHRPCERHDASQNSGDTPAIWPRSIQRISIADEENVRVFDAQDPYWKAVVKGAAGSSARISSVAFGRDEDQIVILSSFGLRIMIWSLLTGRGSEIKDPKPLARGYHIRPGSAHLALLTRPNAHDCLMLLDTSMNEVYKNIEVPTIDAQAVRWSPDGRWLAVQDTISAGYRLLIYTADGHLFKVLLGGHDGEAPGLGVNTLAWSPNAELLAVGDAEERVILYNSSTVRRRKIRFFSIH